MQQAKGKLVLEHLVVQKMGRSQHMKQQDLDELLRFGSELVGAPSFSVPWPEGTDVVCHSSCSCWEVDLRRSCLRFSCFGRERLA